MALIIEEVGQGGPFVNLIPIGERFWQLTSGSASCLIKNSRVHTRISTHFRVLRFNPPLKVDLNLDLKSMQPEVS